MSTPGTDQEPLVTLGLAAPRNIPGIKRLAQANSDTFGFMPTPMLQKACDDQELLVAIRPVGLAQSVVGFVRFHLRRDRRATLYDICVHASLRGQGVGSQLLHTFFAHCREQGCTEVQLKCVVGTRANDFYRKHGFALIGRDPGKKRALNIWSYPLGGEEA